MLNSGVNTADKIQHTGGSDRGDVRSVIQSNFQSEVRIEIGIRILGSEVHPRDFSVVFQWVDAKLRWWPCHGARSHNHL